MHSGARLRGVQSMRGEEAAVHEYLSDVCDEVVNDEEHKNLSGLLASVMKSRMSPSLVLNRIQGSRHVQRVLCCVRENQNTAEKVALEKAKTAAESTASKNTTSEPAATVSDDPTGTSARPLGPLKATVDKELERTCVEKSERVLAVEATADSSTAERKVRQQEQRLKDRKQPKMQNWRGKLMR